MLLKTTDFPFGFSTYLYNVLQKHTKKPELLKGNSSSKQLENFIHIRTVSDIRS